LGQALTGELARRRALLGDHRSVRDRERARAAGADLEPLPALLVVLDRFDTLPTDLPELTEPLLEVARTGAALGVHLLISVRRIRDEVLRGLDRFMTYRIAMRADTPEDSHAVLGSPQAFGLYPGDGILVHGTGTTRFHAPLVSEPVVPPRRRSVVPFTGTHVPVEDTGEHRSPLEAAVAELAGRQPRARAIWTPPLDAATDLSALLGPLTTDPGTGLRADVRGVPIGQVDNVHQHRHETLALELSGHVGVVGGSGSAVLPTLVASLALTRTPREAQVYALDFGEDGALRALAGLPHVGGVATHSDAERVQRIAELVSTLLSDREDLFFRHGVDTLADLAAHEDLSHGEVFVVVDDWGRLARRHPEVADALATSAARGPRHGVHLVVAATRWADVPDRLRSVLDEVLELRLADPRTSTVDPRAAAAVPEHRPGHGLTSTGLRFVTALPRIDGRAGAEDTAVGLAALVARVKAAWSGPPAPPLRVLPDRVDAADLPADHSGRIPIGLGGNDVGPVHVDFAAAPHFLVFGDRGTGKSTLLDVIAAGLPEDARVLRWDRDTPPSTAEIRELVRELGSRTGGPAHVLLVDDYETFAPPGAASPLRPLAALLPRGAELGLHVVVARRAEGAAQARYETVLSALHGMGTPGVVLGGNPDEGAVLGAVAPRRRPPGRGELVGADGSSTVVQLARRHR
ncbi:MAG: type VII secretion protein EccC, partial [Saccharothrix sp.]|nr:type VII secretion protein EccC [Saccharothrix sp.]